jgi:hypothetical protein
MSEGGDSMKTNVLQLELDHAAAGQLLESLAERLLRLERLRADEAGEDAFADAKNDALALRPLYEQIHQLALEMFGDGILSFSASIGELDAIYGLLNGSRSQRDALGTAR